MKIRANQAEQLDNLSLRGDVLHQTLKSLAWINRYFGNHHLMIRSVRSIIQQHPSIQHFRLVDLGCGGGDMLLALANALRADGVAFTLTGIDGNEASLKYAQEKSGAYPTIHYLQADILHPDFRIPACDILISSHFLYHYSAEALVVFLQKNLPKVQLAFINSGLERNIWAERLFRWFGPILPISRMAQQDGLLAIQRAFTRPELEKIVEQTTYPYLLKRGIFFRLVLHLFPPPIGDTP